MAQLHSVVTECHHPPLLRVRPDEKIVGTFCGIKRLWDQTQSTWRDARPDVLWDELLPDQLQRLSTATRPRAGLTGPLLIFRRRGVRARRASWGDCSVRMRVACRFDRSSRTAARSSPQTSWSHVDDATYQITRNNICFKICDGHASCRTQCVLVVVIELVFFFDISHPRPTALCFFPISKLRVVSH